MPTPKQSRSLTVMRYGEGALLVQCGEQSAADVLLAIDRDFGHRLEAHCGEQTVLVRFNPTDLDATELSEALATLRVETTDLKSEHLTLRIRYDGPDLAEVAAATKLTVDGVIALHTSATYRVAFSGFSPGFAYLLGLPPQLHLPRRQSPRPKVPAGSLAIAAHYCAIYPNSSPGGWHLLGTSNAELFNANRNPPALLRPGTSIRFQAVP